MALKVLMMGGYRCGKTSALASLFAQMIHGHANKYLTISDRTPIQNNYLDISLNDKELELQNLLELHKENSSIFLADCSPSYCFTNYKLHLQIPGTHQEMDVDFTDLPSRYFDPESQFFQEMAERIKDYDVFVVAVDTPFLMGSIEDATKKICPEYINFFINNVEGIRNLLSHINNIDGEDAKMVVFVPLKCEKWAKKPDGLNRVTSRVKEIYASLIEYLSASAMINISIIPMQTAGNILFSEFRKAFIYKSENGPIRCCKIDDRIIRLIDGEHILLDNKETVIEDPEAVILGTNIKRPCSWYQINPLDYSYSPKNCDQLLLHILRFIFMAYMKEKKEMSNGPIYWIVPPVNKYKRWLGSMDIRILENVLREMQCDGIILNNRDGIEIIKDYRYA